MIIVVYFFEGRVEAHYRSMLVFAVLGMAITYRVFGVHRRFESLVGGIQQLARAWGVVIIILAWMAFFTKTSELYSRRVVAVWVVSAFFAQSLALLIVQRVYLVYNKRYRKRIPAIILGTGKLASHLALNINKNMWLRDRLVGMVSVSGSETDEWNNKSIPLLGVERDIRKIIEEYDIKRIYIALPFDKSQLIREIQQMLIDVNIDLVWAPDIFEFNLLNHSVREVAGLPLITLNETPLMAGGPAFIKLVMDKSTALLLLFLCSPILIIVALAIKFTSPGPIIFKQVRDGWDGTKFFVYKFRSMYLHKPEKIIKQASRRDPRITPVGAFIRKTSLDELPQLFNILEGSMSLVGPRPHAESHNEYYSDKVKAYLARHRIKPGMTGLAQINGLRGETETVESMARRVELDLEYISNWSILLDIKILFLTPFALISKGDSAY